MYERCLFILTCKERFDKNSLIRIIKYGSHWKVYTACKADPNTLSNVFLLEYWKLMLSLEGSWAFLFKAK